MFGMLRILDHSYKKQKDSLEGNLVQVLFAAELEFPSILVPRLPYNTSNVNIVSTGKSKQCDQLFGTLIYLHFIVLMLMLLVDYTWCKLYNSRSLTLEEKHCCSLYSDRVIDNNLKRQLKNRTVNNCRLFLVT